MAINLYRKLRINSFNLNQYSIIFAITAFMIAFKKVKFYAIEIKILTKVFLFFQLNRYGLFLLTKFFLQVLKHSSEYFIFLIIIISNKTIFPFYLNQLIYTIATFFDLLIHTSIKIY
jgi:hypothetical protein